MLLLSPDQLSVALFRAIARGEASASALPQALLAEIASHCLICRTSLENYVAAEKAREASEGRVLAFPGSNGESREHAETLDLGALEALTPAEREDRVRRSRRRFRGNRAAVSFLVKARQSLPADPASSRCWAELALESLHGVSVESAEEFLESATIDARARGFIANAERIAGNLAEAELQFEHISDFVRASGVLDLRALAELQSFGASLRAAQRRWAEAEALFVSAAELYGVTGDLVSKTRNLTTRALIVLHSGDAQRSFEELQVLWPRASNPRLRLEIRHNQILALLECGEATSAAMLLDESLPLYEQFQDSWTQARLAAVNGRVLHALEFHEPAEKNYRIARARFLSHGDPYTAAVSSLDLAVLLLEAGRWPEVAELALDMLATFRKVGVHAEALVAWQLFVDAAHRQEASAQLAKRLSRYLESARQDPSYRFAPE
jgi:tetratricopeptide (TPR) repeat protein